MVFLLTMVLVDGLLDSIFWLSLAILAVIVPIYVLATSYVGSALDMVRSQAHILRQEIAYMQEMARGSIPEAVRAALNQAVKKHQLNQRRLEDLPRWLSFRRVVLVSGGLTLISYVLSTIGKVSPENTRTWFLLFSLAFIGLGTIYLTICLWHIDQILLKAQPQWRVRISPPDGGNMTAGRPANFHFLVELVTGSVLRGLQIALFIPPQWRSERFPGQGRGSERFPGEERETWTYTVPADDPLMGGYKAFLSITPWTVKVGIPYQYTFYNIVPPDAGDFTCYYLVASEERPLERGSITIRVS